MRGGRLLVGLAMATVLSGAVGPAVTDASSGSNPYGALDEIGAANNLNPAIVRAAVRLVHSGKVYSLAIDTGDPRLNGKPFAGRDYAVHVEQIHASGATIHDDRLTMWMGVFGTSMDGLGHVGRGTRFYNGYRAEEIFAESGLRKLATNAVPPMVTRGILLDFPRYYGVERLPAHQTLNRAEIKAVAKWAHVSIRKGDVVLIHTGWQPLLLAEPARFAEQPGLGVDGAHYLGDLGVVAVGSDNHGVEAIPQQDETGHPLPVHPLLLADYGVYLLEDVRTGELARDRASEFLFVLGQPRLIGTAQVPVNPIAIR